MTIHNVWEMSLFDHFFKVLSLYLEARIRIRTKVKGRIGSGSASKLQAGTCTAKKKCRKFEANIPRKGISGPNFHIHVSVSELYISTMEMLFLLEEISGPILGIYKSLTDT
jgi:hypothetical protein